jgi:hypothetical protein
LLSYIFWGILFIFEFKFFGRDLIPDIIGVILLFIGMSSLSGKNAVFSKGYVTSIFLLAWVLFKYICSVLFATSIMTHYFITSMLDIITIVIQILVVYIFGTGIIASINKDNPALAKQGKRVGAYYFLFAAATIIYRVIIMFRTGYITWLELSLFATSLGIVIMMMLYIKKVSHWTKQSDNSDSFTSYEDLSLADSHIGQLETNKSGDTKTESDPELDTVTDKEQKSSTKIYGILGLICGITSNLPIVIYVLVYWFASATSNPDDPSAGAGWGYAFAFLFIFLSIASILFGIIGGILVIFLSKSDHRTLHNAALVSSIIGGLQPAIIIFAINSMRLFI